MKRKILKCEHRLTPVNEMNEVVANYKITSSFACFTLISEIIRVENLDIFGREYFFTLGLNRANSLIMYEVSSIGGVSGTVADIKIMARSLILTGASGAILWHNHPSGQKKPSEADLKLTEKMKKAFEVLDIPLLDHIIICPLMDRDWEYFSFADDGKI